MMENKKNPEFVLDETGTAYPTQNQVVIDRRPVTWKEKVRKLFSFFTSYSNDLKRGER